MTREEMLQRVLAAGSDNEGVFRMPVGPYKLQQECQEYTDALMFLWEHHKKHPIRSFLEIGTASGGNARMIWDLFKPERMVLVDNDSHYSGAVGRIKILEGTRRVEIIGNSEDAWVREAVCDALPDNADPERSSVVDFVFIDGNHDDPFPTIDADYYSRLAARRGGLVGFHDTHHLEGPRNAVIHMESWDNTFRKVFEVANLYGLTFFERL